VDTCSASSAVRQSLRQSALSGRRSSPSAYLITGTEQVTGQRLTIAALFEPPTIKQFTALIERFDRRGESYVIPTQGRGSKPPFFCVDAGPRYLSLAKHLGADRPFLGLLHPNAIATSIEAIAEFSVKSIRAVQPDGPFFIGGWCAAGLVAYEIGQQLRAQGQEVAHLVLFDAVNPGRLDKLSVKEAIFVQADEFCRKIWFHLRAMTQLSSGNLLAYFLARLKNLWHTLTRRKGPARVTTKFLRQVFSRQSPNMYFMGRRYRPKSYDGRVVLFRRSLRAISRASYLEARFGRRHSR
jgi:thioesterase domain-containing protein